MPEHRQPSPAIADSALTPERIARLRQLHEAASQPPWYTSDFDVEAGETDAELIAAARNALPDLLDAYEHERGEVVFWIRLYAEGIRSWRGTLMELFRRVAAGASLSDVVDLVGEFLDDQDVVDDESIAAFNAAKDASVPSEASTEAPPSPQSDAECQSCSGFGDCGRCDGDGCGAPEARDGYCTDGICTACGGSGLASPEFTEGETP